MKKRPAPVDSVHHPIRLRARSRRLPSAGFGPRVKRHLALAAGILALIAPVRLTAQTFTNPSGSATFTNPTAWDFGAGTFGTWDIPASDAALTLNFQTFGATTITGADDLNLTLGTLNLNTNATAALTLSGSLGGDYGFTGAAKINLFGSGASDGRKTADGSFAGHQVAPGAAQGTPKTVEIIHRHIPLPRLDALKRAQIDPGSFRQFFLSQLRLHPLPANVPPYGDMREDWL